MFRFQAPVSALTWGHNDKRLFLATGTQIHIAWISRRIATLQLLCRLRIHDSIENESKLSSLPLPPRIRSLIGNLFAQTIRVICRPAVRNRLLFRHFLVLRTRNKCFKTIRFEATSRLGSLALHHDPARRGHEHIIRHVLHALSGVSWRTSASAEGQENQQDSTRIRHIRSTS